MTDTNVGLRERTRRAVQAELTSAAMGLFADRGFDATTVDDIAAAAGLSRRSFFRYFPSKDDLLLGNLERVGHQLELALGQRSGSEPPWVALRRSFDGLVAQISADRERSMPLLRMMHRTPSLQASHLKKQSRWRSLLTPEVERRLVDGRHRNDPRAAAIVGAALMCLEAAQVAWVAGDGRSDLGELVDVAMAAVAPLDAALGRVT